MPPSDFELKFCRLISSAPLADRALISGTYSSQDEPKRRCFFIIEVTSPFFQTSKAPAIIEKGIKRLLDGLSERETGVYRFEKAIKKINSDLADLAREGETEWIGALSAAITEIEGNEIFITQTGNVSVYLFRKLKISHLTEGLQTEITPHPLKTFSSLVAGTLYPGDRLVIGNQTLFDYISIDQLRQLVLSFSPSGVTNNLAKEFRRHKVKTASSIVIEIKESEPKIAGKTPQIEPEVIYLDQISRHLILELAKKLLKWLKANWPYLKQTLTKGFLLAKEATKKAYHYLQKRSKERRRDRYQQPFPLLTSQLKKVKPLTKKTSFELKKLLPFIYIALALVIVISGIATIKRSLSSKKTSSEISFKEDENKLAFAKQNLEEAKKALETKETNKARELLLSSQKLLSEINLPNKKEEIEKLKLEIQQSLDSLNKIKRFKNLAASLQIPNASLSQIVYLDQLYGLDNTTGELYLLDITNSKVEKIISSDKLKDALLYAVSNQILASTPNSLVLLDTKEKKVKEFTLPPSNSLPRATKIVDYAGNLYFLDPSRNQIWRVNRRDLTLGEPVEYIKEVDKVVAFKSFAIDGSVWTLSSESIQSWSRGKLDLTLDLKQIPDENKSFDNLFTDSEFSLFLTDKINKRVVELKKDGSYVGETILDSGKESASDIFVHLKTKKVYFLIGGSIYIIGI